DFGAVEVIREIARARERAGFPVVFTSLLFSGGEEEASSSEPMPFRFVYGLNQSPQVWLEQEVSEHGGTLLVSWNAVDDLFPTGLLDDMFAASFGLIEDLASSEEAWERSWAESARALVPADDLVERARVNATDSPLAPLLLHELFEEQAARRPEAVAVAAGERELTYGELDRLSGLLARRLSERGVAPNAL